MNIGNAVKILRKNKRISQKELAKLCDISANALCSIEQGESFPEKNTIIRICKALEIPESYLLLFSISAEDIPENSLSIARARQVNKEGWKDKRK